MNPWIQLKQRSPLFVITLLVASFALLPKVRAVVPAPDGGYPGGNTAEGQNALFSLTTGGYNTAVGFWSLRSNTTSSFNTAVGAGALLANTADNNTATGTGALLSNTAGRWNTANGAFALFSNTIAPSNTAVGFQALFSNTTGGENVAIGSGALRSNNDAWHNTAIGYDALLLNISGESNTAVGTGALQLNTNNDNTAVGYIALLHNTTGFQNSAFGSEALNANVVGAYNTAMGFKALFSNSNGPSNTAVGAYALAANSIASNNTAVGNGVLANNTTGSDNTAMGFQAGLNQTNGSGNVYIGSHVSGVAGESNACYIASIFNQLSPSGAQVYVNSNNKLGTNTSSKRFKDDIKPMDKASEALLALKPVTFRYKKEIDPAGKPQFGLVAEDVEKVNPDLIVRDKEGKPYTVRYDQVNAMLLNEFLKEHKTVEGQRVMIEQLKSNAANQEATISELNKDVRVLTAQLQEQAKQIQKVSALVEMNQSAPQVVQIP